MPITRLRSLRLERNWTLGQVVDRIPAGSLIDRRMLSKLELGQRALTPERSAALAAAFGIDPSELAEDRPPSRS